MLDPSKITNFDLTDAQLEETLFWWVLAAGKDGMRAACCAEAILQELDGHTAPFAVLRKFSHAELTDLLARHKTGAQSLKARTILDLANSGLNLRTCTREELLRFWGMGMKTASCFILHSRLGQQMAGIDTHFLKFLRDHGINVPKHRPAKPRDGQMHPVYLRLERASVEIARKWGWSCAKLDLTVWNTYRLGGRLEVGGALHTKAQG
jgi:hypothetical protein